MAEGDERGVGVTGSRRLVDGAPDTLDDAAGRGQNTGGLSRDAPRLQRLPRVPGGPARAG